MFFRENKAETHPHDKYSAKTKIIASFIQLLLKTGGSHLAAQGNPRVKNIILWLNILMIAHENAIPYLLQYHDAKQSKELDVLWEVFLKNIKPLLSKPQNKMEMIKLIATLASHINRSCYIQAIQRIPNHKRRIDEWVDWVSFIVILIEFSADIARLVLEFQDQGILPKSKDTLINFTSKFALLAYQIISEKYAKIPESSFFYMAKDALPFIVSFYNFLQGKNTSVEAMASVEYFGGMLYRYATDFYQKESNKGKLKNFTLFMKQGNMKLSQTPVTELKKDFS